MTFTARIRPHSVIWNLWKGHARTGGAIHGVLFSWVSGSDFASKKLTPAEVNALKLHPDVVLEVVAEAPSAIAIDAAVSDVPQPFASIVAEPSTEENVATAAIQEFDKVVVVPATPLASQDANTGLYGARSRSVGASEPKQMPSLDEINARRREADQRRRDAKRQK